MKFPSHRYWKLGLAGGAILVAGTLLFVSPVSAIIAAAGGEPTVHVEDDEFASLANTLRIVQKKMTVKFPNFVSELNCDIEFYSNGQKQPGTGTVGHQQFAYREKQFRLAITVIDLDYLKLGDGNAGNCRWEIQLGSKTFLERSENLDVPKATIDPSRTYTWGTFRNPKATADGFPLYWMTGRSKDAKIKVASTAAELVANNPATEFAILTLRAK